MNVDELTLRHQISELEYKTECQKIENDLLRKEVERLRAELAQLRKDWCDDDEAIKQQALRVLPKFEVEGDSVHVPRMGELAKMMADEALRQKEEGLAWMMAAQDKERDLAAAKAASVVPVKVVDWGTVGDHAEIEVTDYRLDFESEEDLWVFHEWFGDRMKERGE